MRVGVIGINHKHAELNLRELFAKSCQFRFGNGTCSGHSLILLSTCNRTEVYFSSPNLADTHSSLLHALSLDLEEVVESFGQKLYSYFGHDCFKHLARVTAGLDSAIIAETEIQGQVKCAYEKALEHAILPSELHFLFQKSLKIGKEIRTELSLGRGVPDIEHAIMNAGFHFFDKPENTNILFVGASEINRKILAFLKGKGCENITLCNRSENTCLEMCKKFALEHLPWGQLKTWPAFDWVIFGTKAPDYIISKQDLVNRPTDKLIIDLCVPRNVDPRLGKDPSITLLNIDQLNRMLKFRKKRINHCLIQAEEYVHTATKWQIELLQAKAERKQLLASA